ncbi:MAG: tetratricopeptide repeat protein [Elusimicrobiaceae bacterium]|nr:tetratricopeptide repeat protein [Elusimicrobiaceae bacterium]
MNFGKCVTAALLVAACAAAVARAETMSEQADREYRSGNFEEAISLYREMARQEPHNPFHYYNLGNAYYKTARTGRGVANYYRAFELLPRNADIRHNLAFALNTTGGKLIPEGMPEGIFVLFHYFSAIELKGLTVVCLWLTLLFLAAMTAAPAMRKYLRGITMSSAVLALVFGGWAYARKQADLQNPAVVIDGIAEIRTGPGENFTAAATVPEGHVLEVLSETDGWAEVGLKKEGVKGWVQKKFIEPAGL